MNRPFLLTIAFAVLVFNTSIAWADSSTEILTWRSNLEPLFTLLKPFFAPLAILISSAVTWIIATWTILANKKIQRRRVTVDYMSRLSWGKDYTEVRKNFLELKAQGIHFSKIAENYDALPKKHSTAKNTLSTEEQTIIDNHDIIRKILNEYEAMAVAIRMGVYDKKIIKISREQAVLSDLRTCGTFIGATRTARGVKTEYPNPGAIYKECCDLYKEWSGKDLETLK